LTHNVFTAGLIACAQFLEEGYETLKTPVHDSSYVDVTTVVKLRPRVLNFSFWLGSLKCLKYT